MNFVSITIYATRCRKILRKSYFLKWIHKLENVIQIGIELLDLTLRDVRSLSFSLIARRWPATACMRIYHQIEFPSPTSRIAETWIKEPLYNGNAHKNRKKQTLFIAHLSCFDFRESTNFRCSILRGTSAWIFNLEAKRIRRKSIGYLTMHF